MGFTSEQLKIIHDHYVEMAKGQTNSALIIQTGNVSPEASKKVSTNMAVIDILEQRLQSNSGDNNVKYPFFRTGCL